MDVFCAICALVFIALTFWSCERAVISESLVANSLSGSESQMNLSREGLKNEASCMIDRALAACRFRKHSGRLAVSGCREFGMLRVFHGCC